MNNVCATLALVDDLLEQAKDEQPGEPCTRTVETTDVEFILPMSEAVLV